MRSGWIPWGRAEFGQSDSTRRRVRRAWYARVVRPSAFASPDFALPRAGFETAVRVGVAEGLDAAAVYDVEGKPIAVSGELDEVEVQAIEMVLAGRMREDGRLVRMLDGQLLRSPLGEREIMIGIAANCVFVVAVRNPLVEMSRDPLGRAIAFDVFQSFVARVINDARARVTRSRPPLGGSGGSSSGPAELPVVEWGVTVPRRGRS